VFYATKRQGNEIIGEIINLKGKSILDNIYVNPFVTKSDLLKCGVVEKKDNDTYLYFNLLGERIFRNFDHVNYKGYGQYITVTRNRKSGVADIKGNIIIPTIFDSCIIYNNCNLILASLGDKYGLFDTQGGSIASFEYDSIKIYQDYSIIIVRKDNLYGAINMQGKEIIPREFEELKIEIGGSCWTQKNYLTGKYGVFDHKYDSSAYEEGSKVIPYIFDTCKIYDAVIAKKNGKYGMFGFNGRIIADCIYKDLTLCFNGTARFSDDKNIGIISVHDKELFRTSFKYIFIQAFANNNRYIAVNSNYKGGLLDARGNEVTEFIYDDLEHISHGITKVSKKIETEHYHYYLHGLINSYGDVILPIEYRKISYINDNLFEVQTDKNESYFCCNENGVRVIDDFKTRAIVGNLIFIGRWDNNSKQDDHSSPKLKFQIFNKMGEMISSTLYDDIGCDCDFVLGLCKVSRNGKFGLINEQGVEVIPCKYDDVRVPIKIDSKRSIKQSFD
jgi:hypothetical protein